MRSISSSRTTGMVAVVVGVEVTNAMLTGDVRCDKSSWLCYEDDEDGRVDFRSRWRGAWAGGNK